MASDPERGTLSGMYRAQLKLMDMLVERGKLPSYPLDITSKESQKLLKLTAWALVEELGEAMNALKNRAHKISDDTAIDFTHYLEELAGDVMAYYLEICAFSGITPDMLYDEYIRKNAVCQQRILGGY